MNILNWVVGQTNIKRNEKQHNSPPVSSSPWFPLYNIQSTTLEKPSNAWGNKHLRTAISSVDPFRKISVAQMVTPISSPDDPLPATSDSRGGAFILCVEGAPDQRDAKKSWAMFRALYGDPRFAVVGGRVEGLDR